MRGSVCKGSFPPIMSAWPKLIYIGEKFIFLVAVLALASVILLHRQAFVPLLYPVIRDVQLQGRFVHIERMHVDRLVRDSIGRNFFSIDLQTIKRAVETLPWVKHARVTKTWPHTLSVTIEEHHAEAQWREDSLISSESVVFHPGGAIEQRLPILYAPQGREAVALAKYREAKELLEPADIGRIEALVEDPLGAWRMLLANGVLVRIGDIDWERRLRRFVVVWKSELREQSHRIRYVDLRYSDGCAVGWKS